MISRLSKARKHYLCDCCGQLIVTGEVYRYQCWAPWELEDPDGYYLSHSCRWCADRYWRWTDGDGWSTEANSCDWLCDERNRWLEEAGIVLEQCGSEDCEAYRAPLRDAQHSARRRRERTRNRPVLLEFYRLLGVDPWADGPDRWPFRDLSPAGYLVRRMRVAP